MTDSYSTYYLRIPGGATLYMNRYSDGTLIPFGLKGSDGQPIRTRMPSQTFNAFLAAARELGLDAGKL